MRNLQGSTDTELDQSMGRKAARLARKPHVVGSIALDQRLRAQEPGGGGGDGTAADWESLPVGPAWVQMQHYWWGVMESDWGPDPRLFVVFQPFDITANVRFVSTELGMDIGIFVTPGAGASGVTGPIILPAGSRFDIVVTRYPDEVSHTFNCVWPEGLVQDGESAPPGWEPPPQSQQAFPWDAMTTHAQIDGWVAQNGVVTGVEWAQMTLASKRQWLVAYFDGARPWETGN